MAKRKPKFEARKIAPGIKEKISRRSGVTQSLTEISSNASPADETRVISQGGPLGFVNEVRERVQRNERFLHDRGLDITLADDAPTPTHLELLERMEQLGYGPLKDETISVQIVLSGKAILRTPREHEPLILQAISYGMATFEQDHFAEIEQLAKESGKKKRRDPLLSALLAWPELNPDKVINLIMQHLPSSRPTNPNAGKYLLWLDAVTIYVYDTESHETFPYKKRSLERRIRRIRDQRKK